MFLKHEKILSREGLTCPSCLHEVPNIVLGAFCIPIQAEKPHFYFCGSVIGRPRPATKHRANDVIPKKSVGIASLFTNFDTHKFIVFLKTHAYNFEPIFVHFLIHIILTSLISHVKIQRTGLVSIFEQLAFTQQRSRKVVSSCLR